MRETGRAQVRCTQTFDIIGSASQLYKSCLKDSAIKKLTRNPVTSGPRNMLGILQYLKKLCITSLYTSNLYNIFLGRTLLRLIETYDLDIEGLTAGIIGKTVYQIILGIFFRRKSILCPSVRASVPPLVY